MNAVFFFNEIGFRYKNLNDLIVCTKLNVEVIFRRKKV